MAENPFKVGDVVECIDNKPNGYLHCPLTEGEEYVVKRINGSNDIAIDGQGSWKSSRFRLVSRPSEEWRNGDDVIVSGQPAKYIGPDDTKGFHVVRIFDASGSSELQSWASNAIRRPKPARTLEQLLERLGEGWIVDRLEEPDPDIGLRWFVLELDKDVDGQLSQSVTFWEPTRQACIDVAWELLVKEDGDGTDSAE